MTKDETKEILKKIDVTYQTDFLKNQNYVSEWHKELKNYDYEQINTILESHGFSMQNRAEQIPIDIFIEISNQI